MLHGLCILYSPNALRNPIISLFVGIFLSGILLDMPSSQAATPGFLASNYKIEITPDQMTLSGDVTTRANCVHPTVCSWLDGTPIGTIMLGVDPASPSPSDWGGGSVTATVSLPDVHSPTVYVLKLSWPTRDGKGLQSPDRNRLATITFDGQLLWSKRTTRQSTFND